MKKILYTLLFAFVFSSLQGQSLRYLLKYPYRVIDGKHEASPANNGDSQLCYTNSDYCPYTLIRKQKELHKLQKGKNVVEYYKKNSVVNKPENGSYNFYRGVFPMDFNPSFVYSLPVRPNSNVEWMIDPRERSRTFTFKINYRDTVYACRRGVVCKTDYLSGVLLYHKDDTFAAYLNLSELLVFPGESVDVGTPIALASHSGLSVSFFFLDENLFQNGKPSGYAYTHFSPVFRTDKGDVKLAKGEKYTCVLDEQLIMQDMGKSEQKKYLKRKSR